MSYINDDKITYFAETDYRGNKTRFGIKGKDRTKHMYILGKTGMGKSTLLENMAIQDVQNDEGIIFIDPHGSSAVKILEYIPKHRVDDVVYFSPNDIEYPFSFNILEKVQPERRSFVVQGLMTTFKKIWADQFSSRMEYLLNYCLLALLETPDATILSINRLLGDKDYRNYCLEYVTDSVVLNFWKNEFDKYSKDYANEAVAPIQNKIGQFVTNPMIRNILGQTDTKIDFRKLMDEKKIVIVNLSKGLIGPDNMRLIGGMLITKIYIATMSRANLSPGELEEVAPSYLYIDEFQNFANNSFSEILSESRKYKLALIMSNQYFDQVEENVRKSILGNVGTLILFRVGSNDAQIMEKEMAPTFTKEHLVNLQFTQIYLRLMIDGVTSKPFSATTLAPIIAPKENYVTDIVFVSRQKYTRTKKEVEMQIRDWNLRKFKNDDNNSMPISNEVAISQEEAFTNTDKTLENKTNKGFDFTDSFDDIEDDFEFKEDIRDNLDKEIISNEEEKATLEEKQVKIPEVKQEIIIPEVKSNVTKFVNSRKNAKLNAIVSHIKNSEANTSLRTKKEVPEDVLRNLLNS